MRTTKSGTLTLIAVAAVLAWVAAPASAATITVTSAFEGMPTDPQCSLREAVTAANLNAGDTNAACINGQATLDTIVFQAALGDPILNSAMGTLSVQADTEGPLRIQGPGLTMQVYSNTGTISIISLGAAGVLTIADIEVVGGNGGTGFGGAIDDGGTLTLEDAKVSGGTAAKGGGVWASGAAAGLTLTNSTVSGNTANGAGGGGGILYEGTGSLILMNSVVSGNHATSSTGIGGGGVLYNGGGSLSLTNSTVTGNDTAGFAGGGIFAGVASGINATITGSTISGNQTTSGTSANGAGGGLSYFGDAGEKLRLIDSTVSGNTSVNTARAGGGINVFGEAAVVNSTISGNMATAGSGGGLSGGGGGAATATVNLISSTVAGNTAMDNGPGLYAFNGTFTLRNSIVANGASACSDEMGGFGGNIVTAGFNVDEGTSCDLNPASGDSEGVSAGIGPLAPNGGPTLTRAITMGSPAVNRVPTGSCTNDLGAALTTDQRGAGFVRPVGGACDSGAFEVQPPPPPIQPGGTTPASTSARGKQCKKKKRKKARGAAQAAKRKKCKRKKRRTLRESA